jgi:NMD protein affecting ribosome stability and mRNA decay
VSDTPLCTVCGKQPAHPLYCTRCEDCYVAATKAEGDGRPRMPDRALCDDRNAAQIRAETEAQHRHNDATRIGDH